MSQFKNLIDRFSSGFDALPKDVTFVFDLERKSKRKRKQKLLNPELKANKFLLALASPVFEAMFNGLLKEQTDRIYIKDIKESAFKMLINFIYLKEVTFESVNEALDIYKAADKYDLPDLCEIVNNFIQPKITVENVCQIYEHSTLFKISSLKEICKRIFIQDTERVLKSSGFLQSFITTVNDIYTISGLEIESEVILCKALVQYVTTQNISLRDVRKYLHPCLSSIRFLTLPLETIDGFGGILSKHEQKLVKNALENSQITRLPKNFNTSRKQRYTRAVPEFPASQTLSDKYLYSYNF